MALVDLVMPKMGESIMEATILKWHKQPGDHIKMDETVLEIATDKVDTEVPSTTEGVVQELLFNVNDVVPVGSVIARVKTEVEEGTGHKEQERGEDEMYKAQDIRHKEQEMHEEAGTISHTNITSNLSSDSYRN